jgi:hypothetical protein
VLPIAQGNPAIVTIVHVFRSVTPSGAALAVKGDRGLIACS